MRFALFKISLVVYCFLIVTACQQQTKDQARLNYKVWSGKTMGTTYTIKALTNNIDAKRKIDSLLTGV